MFEKKSVYEIRRKNVVLGMVLIAVFGVLFGYYLQEIIVNYVKLSASNLTICIILFTLIIEMIWMPFILNTSRVTMVMENGIRLMPQYSHWKSLGILFHILIHNDAQAYYRFIPIEEIAKVRISFERKWGNWGYSRYSLLLYVTLQTKEQILLYINPMTNGPFMPPAQGGIPLFGYKTHNDIWNLFQFFKAGGVEVEDPYALTSALQDPNLVLYDYLESIHKDYKF